MIFILDDENVTMNSASSITETTRSLDFSTPRELQIWLARQALEALGWECFNLSSADHPRRPLLLAGEAMNFPLDGSRADERGQGFIAKLGETSIFVDACAGLPLNIVTDFKESDLGVFKPRSACAIAERVIKHFLLPSA